jgi:hypothetical protein
MVDVVTAVMLVEHTVLLVIAILTLVFMVQLHRKL